MRPLYTEVFTLKISATQKRTLEKLKSRNIKVSDFVRKAIPDNNNKDFIYCYLDGEVGDREFCKKSQCKDYNSTSGRGVCSHRGKLFEKGEKVNVKKLIK